LEWENTVGSLESEYCRWSFKYDVGGKNSKIRNGSLKYVLWLTYQNIFDGDRNCRPNKKWHTSKKGVTKWRHARHGLFIKVFWGKLLKFQTIPSECRPHILSEAGTCKPSTHFTIKIQNSPKKSRPTREQDT